MSQRPAPLRWPDAALALVAATVVAAGLVSAGAALAAEHPDARHTALEANPFHLEPSGEGVFTTGDASTLGHLEGRLGAAVHYLTRPLVVRPVDPTRPDRRLVEDRLQIDLLGAIGLGDRWEFGLGIPVIASQDAELPGFRLGGVDSAGLGDVRLHGEVELLQAAQSPVAVSLAVPVTLPTASAAAYMGYDGLTAAPQLRAASRLGPVLLAVNGGVQFQPSLSLFSVEDRHKVVGAAGVAFDAGSWQIGAELFGATPLDDPLSNSGASRAEAVGGVTYLPADWLAVQVGGGTGLVDGIGASAWRTFLTVGWRYERDPGDVCLDPPGGSYAAVSPARCPELDFDRDRVDNADDACPRDPEDRDGFADADGCPELDNDGDAIADVDDQCPDTAEDIDGFEDADGCPDADNDADGIADATDQCPNEPETKNGKNDDDGCPDEAGTKVTVGEERLEITDRLYFETDRAVIDRKSYALLNEIADVLEANPELRLVEIRGYADRRGSSDYNFQLSRERAKVVRLYLIEMGGIDADRLRAEGFGEFQQSEEVADEGAWAAERRVDFEIIERSDD